MHPTLSSLSFTLKCWGEVGKNERNCDIPGEVPYLSEADSLAKAARASGKLGGVAGVLAGVHNCNKNK